MRLRYPNPAMVVAIAALVVASTGSAIAARQYLISSTGQIAPSVLKQLHGARGARGAAGSRGQAGAVGPAGAPGAPGTNGTNGSNGTNGADLTTHTPLASGQTETGVFAFTTTQTSSSQVAVPITFTQPLSAPLDAAHVIDTATTATHCTGPGHADPGYLCVYRASSTTGTALAFSVDPTTTATFGAGKLGAVLGYTPGAGTTPPPFAYGTWAVTAP